MRFNPKGVFMWASLAGCAASLAFHSTDGAWAFAALSLFVVFFM